MWGLLGGLSNMGAERWTFLAGCQDGGAAVGAGAGWRTPLGTAGPAGSSRPAGRLRAGLGVGRALLAPEPGPERRLEPRVTGS